MNQKAVKKIDKYSYNKNNLLGRGSYAQVFKGINTITKEEVAIKQLKKKEICSDEFLQQSLFEEIKCMKKLNSINVVRFLDVFETQNNYYIIQELCEKKNVGTILKERKILPEEEALGILKDILSGFIDLLNHGIIHRDLKPDNILQKNGKYKLADFGFARTVQKFKSQMMSSSVGTPLYMSPQILKKQKYTTKTDIFSIAIIYYEMLYGQTPWDASTQYELVQKQELEPLKFPNFIQISKKSKDFITKCLIVEEAERISWQEIYQHPLFDNYYHKYNEKNQPEIQNNFLQVNIRQMLSQVQNIDLIVKDNTFDSSSILTYVQFENLLSKMIDCPHEEIFNFYQTLEIEQDGKIKLSNFQKFLQQNHIRQSNKKEIEDQEDDGIQKSLYRQISYNIDENSISTEKESFNQNNNQNNNYSNNYSNNLKINTKNKIIQQQNQIPNLYPLNNNNMNTKFEVQRKRNSTQHYNNNINNYINTQDKNKQLSLQDNQKNYLLSDPFKIKTHKNNYIIEDNKSNSKIPDKGRAIIKNLFQKIIEHKVDLKILYKTYDTSQLNQLSLENLFSMISKIESNIILEEVRQAFQIFLQKNQDQNYITFEQFVGTIKRSKDLLY